MGFSHFHRESLPGDLTVLGLIPHTSQDIRLTLRETSRKENVSKK